MIAWGPAGLWAGVLFLLSESSGVPSIIWFAVNDKLVHFVLYFVLGTALSWAKLKSPFTTPHIVAVGVGFAYGAVDEWHQSFVPGRIPALDDFVVDCIGVVVGYSLVLFTASFLRRREAASPT